MTLSFALSLRRPIDKLSSTMNHSRPWPSLFTPFPPNGNDERNLNVDPNSTDHIHCTESNGESSRDANEWEGCD